MEAFFTQPHDQPTPHLFTHNALSNVSDAAWVLSSEEANERSGREKLDPAKLPGCSTVPAELLD